MRNIILFIIVIIGGVCTTLQGPVNVQLGIHFTHSPIYTTFISFIASSVLLAILAVLTRVPKPTWHERTTKWWNWTGGILGAAYVGMMIIAVETLGTAATMATALLGQIVFSIVLDHFGVFGMKVQKINLTRVSGIILVLAGAWLVRSY